METVQDTPRTKVRFDWPFRLNSDTSRIASCGSCFAENVVGLLSGAGLSCEQNPNGILYNPYSLFVALQRVMLNHPYEKSDFFEYGGLWHSWNHHGSFSAPSADEALARAESARIRFMEFLRTADMLILTPASAVVFELADTERIVANCHKLPGNQFKRRLLTSAECLNALCGIAEGMRIFNPECRIVFTLSPVRHNPGELILNARSKALVLNAIHECIDRCGCDSTFYFPGYEIVLDELRDYRFFKEDMLHPGDFAVKLVARTFAAACFGKAVLTKLDDFEKRMRRSCHVEKRSL